MCVPKVKVPKAEAPAAAPAAPLPTADALKMNERLTSGDGSVGPNTARSRRSLRTDIRVSGARTGVSVARMTA